MSRHSVLYAAAATAAMILPSLAEARPGSNCSEGIGRILCSAQGNGGPSQFGRNGSFDGPSEFPRGGDRSGAPNFRDGGSPFAGRGNAPVPFGEVRGRGAPSFGAPPPLQVAQSRVGQQIRPDIGDRVLPGPLGLAPLAVGRSYRLIDGGVFEIDDRTQTIVGLALLLNAID